MIVFTSLESEPEDVALDRIWRIAYREPVKDRALGWPFET